MQFSDYTPSRHSALREASGKSYHQCIRAASFAICVVYRTSISIHNVAAICPLTVPCVLIAAWLQTNSLRRFSRRHRVVSPVLFCVKLCPSRITEQWFHNDFTSRQNQNKSKPSQPKNQFFHRFSYSKGARWSQGLLGAGQGKRRG